MPKTGQQTENFLCTGSLRWQEVSRTNLPPSFALPFK